MAGQRGNHCQGKDCCNILPRLLGSMKLGDDAGAKTAGAVGSGSTCLACRTNQGQQTSKRCSHCRPVAAFADIAALPRHAVQGPHWTAPLDSHVPCDPTACLRSTAAPHARQTLGDGTPAAELPGAVMQPHHASAAANAAQPVPPSMAEDARSSNAALQCMLVQTAKAAALAPSIAPLKEHADPLWHCITAAHSPECSVRVHPGSRPVAACDTQALRQPLAPLACPV